MSRRIMGKASFAHISDEDGKMQVYIKRDEVGEDDISTQILGQKVGAPGKASAHGADQDTGAVDIENHGKSHAANETSHIHHEVAVIN